MALQSGLVTAPKGTTVLQYEIRVNSKVNTEEVTVDKKADELYEKIYSAYSKLSKTFAEIATEYRNCASQSVKGDSICSALKKVAQKCEADSKNCITRQKNLQEYYKKSVTEKYTNELNTAIGA